MARLLLLCISCTPNSLVSLSLLTMINLPGFNFLYNYCYSTNYCIVTIFRGESRSLQGKERCTKLGTMCFFVSNCTVVAAVDSDH